MMRIMIHIGVVVVVVVVVVLLAVDIQVGKPIGVLGVVAASNRVLR